MMRGLVARMLFDWNVWRLKRKLLRTRPDYRAAYEAEQRDRRQHKPTRVHEAMKRAALHDELRREVSHG
jgi:glucose-6-phosphate isomerase